MAVVRGSTGGEVEVEGTLEDGGVGDGVDVVEGEEVEGFLEAPEYACGEEEEEAWLLRATLAFPLVVQCEWGTYHPCFP